MIRLAELGWGRENPTLMLHATRDARAPFTDGPLLASLIPGARFAPLESNNLRALATEPAWIRWRDEMRSFLSATQVADPLFATLTPRERELVELIAQGCDNAQIGARLDLRDKTVRNHITSIFAKLEVENRGRAIVLARDAGFGR